MGFDELFPIQAEAIAPILQGRDLIGQAHTGSGKTLAYAVPMLQNIQQNQPGIQGLVLAPTRELAVQVATEFEKLAKHLRIRTVPVYGGQSINVQLDRLEDPRAKIVVATPGRLMDHLDRRTIQLDKVAFVVLDEADRMLDMGFIDDIQTILNYVPRNHQTALFSATMPDQIVHLSQRYLRNPLKVFVDSDEVSVDTVDQKIVQVEEDAKLQALCSLLDRPNLPTHSHRRGCASARHSKSQPRHKLRHARGPANVFPSHRKNSPSRTTRRRNQPLNPG